MDLNNTFSDKNLFTGIYRGYVVWNNDPKNCGRIKIFVPGIYSEKYESNPGSLPWARPMSPIFGGNSTNRNKEVLNNEVGWCTVPHAGNISTGAQVFLFFENGNINFPVYIGAAQSGDGWFSEHPNQHCFRSDNIKVKIDENFKDERSTSKNNSYTSHNSVLAKANLERKSELNGWNFNNSKGHVEQLETRLDIEIEASKYNAVNLNIHGNVNMHIDGDWFVEHIGDYYEYRKGDRYLKQDGNTYIENNGIERKSLIGDKTFDHTGNYTKTQVGDTLLVSHGSHNENIDNDANYIYGQNLNKKIGKSFQEIVGYDKNESIGNNYCINILNDFSLNTAGSFDFDIDTGLNFNVRDNISFHSREGNILLQTDGQFELMKDKVVTCNGFKNLGNKGNIQFISTFGNINMQCIKNDELADFNQKTTVIPWNPSFLAHIVDLYKTDFDLYKAALDGMKFPVDIKNIEDFKSLLKDAEKLKIYDGLPVFIPTKMIVQNPNLIIPNSKYDDSWVSSFRSEPENWKDNIKNFMWKIPGRMMGNINIETWSGDINIKTDSTIGCAGNINIEASENGGTLPGYKIGSVSFKNFGKERIYPDPRDLFFDSDFMKKESGKYELFKHGTYGDSGLMFVGADSIELKEIFGGSFEFFKTKYNKNNKLGCSKCIADYILGVHKISDIFYQNNNIIDLKSGRHEYGFQRINPNDTINQRGTFNIETNDFDKISIGDGHAIEIGFMDKSFSSNAIGGFTINSNGNMQCLIGKNSYTHINYLRKNGISKNDYIYTDNHMDYYSFDKLNKFTNLITKKYKSEGNGYDYITPGSSIILADKCGASKKIDTNFSNIQIVPEILWQDHGFLNYHINSIGNDNIIEEKIDKRTFIDYGFNFEKCKNIINDTVLKNLNVNFYENKKYEFKQNRLIDNTIISGGDSVKFNVIGFSNDEHVELDVSLNEYSYIFSDVSKNHKKHYKFHDKASVWWDNKNFSKDLVPFFPDSEFDANFEKYEQMYGNELSGNNNVNELKKHHIWSKYGNHVFEGKHYLNISDKCDLTYKKVESKDDKKSNEINTAEKLWVNKRGGGIENIHIINKNIDINEPINIISLNTNDHKNHKINEVKYFNSGNDIIISEEKNAKNNNFYDSIINGDANRRSIIYKAAVNTHIIELNSDHAVLEKINKNPKESFKDNNYNLQAGNLYRTILKGNQDYYNYKLDEKTQNEYIIHHVPHSNNFEFSQNGFPMNKFKFLNGTNTKWNNSRKPSATGKWPDGKNPSGGHFGENEFIFSNGGFGDNCSPTENENLGINFMVSSLNNFKISNGVNTENISFNNFGLDNGIGVVQGINTTLLNNGDILNNGQNIIRINNEGMTNADNVINSITLNNDHQNQNIVISDKWNSGSQDKSIVSLYSSNKINVSSNKEITLNSPTINSISLKNNIDSNLFFIRSNDYILNSLNSKTLSNNFKIDSNMYNMIGETINIEAPSVMIKNISATGMLKGHVDGSFNGCAMYNGYQYSIDWPIKDSVPTQTMRQAGKIVTIQPLEHENVIIDPPIYTPPKINKLNKETTEETSFNIVKSLKKVFKSFIKLELSLINIDTYK